MGKELSLQQKKDLAYALYMSDDMSQQELADKVGLSKPTISKCIKEGMWQELKEAMSISREEQLKNFTSQLNALNNHIKDRKPPEGTPYPTSKEVDIQIKLAKAIDMLKGDASLTEQIFFSKRFIDFLRKHHTDKVKEITLLLNQFVNENV